ncbi:hypothetical protein K3G63_10855 [Hymenobacter sp. HSC-4F20]|uniref:hypothetical protein n=1 Tax=Hymenobacter sp. HSC-4F20 TaxID=2864135 RepID=UPI001C731DC7|nr:hypothetical protein [Hymenobacter sp. HSC-4F20]MBX0290941.1 hypothetical protein [Hymenobacter sp. HSC-4F20]
MRTDTTPKKRGPKPAPATVEGRDVAAEWTHLRTWVAANRDMLNLAGIGARCGLSKEATRALLTPPADATKAPRTSATVLKLENLQRVCGAVGYNCPTSHHLLL